MDKPLISLLVPCYNVGDKCDKFFLSLVNQTYTNIELVIVNDGSSDNTEEKIFSYKPQLENVGFIVKYFYQENLGVGVATNKAIKNFTGEYVCWADPDDYYEENSFELRLNYMIEHPDCAIVTSDAYIRNGEKCTILSDSFPRNSEKNQFEAMLLKESIICAGCHMVRTCCFDRAIKNRDIYEDRKGQNWQLLLPILYFYDRDFLSIPLYDYIIYGNSLSHSVKSYEDYSDRYLRDKIILTETLHRIEMSIDEKKKYFDLINVDYWKDMLNLAYINKKKRAFRIAYKELKKLKTFNVKWAIKGIIINLRKG